MNLKSYIINGVLILLTAVWLTSCGKGTVEIDENQYEAKIAIEAILIPNQPVKRIFISRNFRVNQNLQRTTIFLPNADVVLTDVANDAIYTLQYDPDSLWYYYPGNDLTIGYEQTYRLNVTATIEGKRLQASASTTTPKAGLEIVSVNHDTLSYFQRNANDELLFFELAIQRSPGTDFYLQTTTALDATVESYVYDNPYEDLDEEDVRDDLNDLLYEWEWIQNTPLTPGVTNMEIFWFDLWFYGRYEIVVYAADPNYQDFIRTYNNVQDDDGNFHAPVFHIEGDGIGVFGSAVADTVYLTITP